MFFTKNTDGLLNLFLNVPAEVKENIAKLSENDDLLKGKIELTVLFVGNVDNIKMEVDKLGGTFEDLEFGFGIVTVDTSKVEQVALISQIQYVEFPKTLYTTSLASNKAICVQEAWEVYGLTGKGILVGFIDSGIDYMHPAFRENDGNTRIDYIYDLGGGGQVWNKEDINRAIKSDNPYAIVPQRDTLGHGTHVAGIACAGGKIDKRYYGVAYESSIAMVKMTSTGKLTSIKSTQLLRGVKFLLDKSFELNKPLVINLSFSTNDGAHDGNSLLEQYINTVCSLKRLSFVVAAGNDGDKGHHVGGELRQKQDINISISPGERGIIFQLYKNLLDDISIELKDPSGKSSGVIKIKEGYISGNIGNNKYFLYDTGPTPFNINGEITLSLAALNQFLTDGVWTLTIYSEEEQGRNYNIWMPVSEGLNKNTRFLKANPFNTVGIPATAFNVIAVGSYNYVTNTISSFSGRGRLNSNIIKPDLVSPGENIEAPIPGGLFDALSGTSMAAPHVAGAAALMMQFGLILGKDPYLYGERLKYFLLKGATRDRTDVKYPNPIWGYGRLCLRKALEIWSMEGRMRIHYQHDKEFFRDDWTNSFNTEYNQIKFRQDCGELYINDEYESFIVEYDGDIELAFKDIQDACAFVIDDNYAIVTIRSEKKEEIINNIKEIIYVEDPSLYTLNAISPIDAANISKFHENPFLSLRGQGVLIGILDTGIDYLNKEFMYEDDTTRILSIWDQTIGKGTKPKGFNFGTEYTNEQINKAISAKAAGQNPYEIVDSKDEIGHGTKMAGLIGARGREGVIGAAPDCEFVVVKMKQVKKSMLEKNGIIENDNVIYDSTDVLLAIKYLYNTAKLNNKPMVIYIPMGTNKGGHDGNAIVERYIDDISKVRGMVVVTSTGNEGDSDTHTEGVIVRTGDINTIELKIDEMQKNISFSIWGHKPDKISIGLVSPSGEVIEKIPAKLQETEKIKFVFEGSIAEVRYSIPEELTGDELISVNIKNVKGGIWQIRLIGDYILNGKYHIWLPQRQLLKAETRFLNPSPYTTLTIPSTSRLIITTAFYNQNNNTLVAMSGRGNTRDGRTRPDVATGGINAVTTAVGGGTTTVSGASVAAAVLAGAVALMLQWGIVDGNDKTLYSPKIKTYLIRGTAKRAGDIYPNTQWGYGMLDLMKVFEGARTLEVTDEVKQQDSEVMGAQMGISNSGFDVYNGEYIYENDGIFICIPRGILD